MTNELDIISGKGKSREIKLAEERVKNNLEIFKGISKTGEVTVVSGSSLEMKIADDTKQKLDNKRAFEKVKGIKYDSMKGNIKAIDKTIAKMKNKNIILANDITDDFEMFIEFQRNLDYIITNTDFFKKVSNRFRLVNLLDKSKYLDLSIPFIEGVGITKYTDELFYDTIQENDIIGIHHMNTKNKFDPRSSKGMGITNMPPLKNKYNEEEILYLAQQILKKIPVATVDVFKKLKITTYSLMYDDVVTIVSTDNDLIFLDNYPYKLEDYLSKMKEIFKLKVSLADIKRENAEKGPSTFQFEITDGTPLIADENGNFPEPVKSMEEMTLEFIETEEKEFNKIQDDFGKHIVSQKLLLLVSGIPSTAYKLCESDLRSDRYLYNYFKSNHHIVGDYDRFWKNFKEYEPVVKSRNEYLKYLLNISNKKFEAGEINKFEKERFETIFRRASLIVLYYNLLRNMNLMDNLSSADEIETDIPY